MILIVDIFLCLTEMEIVESSTTAHILYGCPQVFIVLLIWLYIYDIWHVILARFSVGLKIKYFSQFSNS